MSITSAAATMFLRYRSRIVIEQLKSVLKKYWGYDSFLPLQQEAMLSASSGRDSLVVLPTGGGKSLCYQAPAMTMEGLTVVVSPLISLMKDQVDALIECGIEAARLDSSLNQIERDEIFKRLAGNQLKILYLSPERIMSVGFAEYLGRIKPAMIAIDEAHCVSMWGHDFRPEYRQLGQLKKCLGNIAIHAYTATATEHVRRDIVEQLHLDKPTVLVGSFDRPNLVYRVKARNDRIKQVCAVLDRHKNESGIIYCIRRRDVDELCAALNEKGYNAAAYHAGLDDDTRRRNQDLFIKERVDTIVATIAFGMGIDKSNVRYVVHTGLPKSIEHYQQESGRAGRDGLEAECCLFHSGGDYHTWKRILGQMEEEPARIAVDKLGEMYDFCNSAECRHAAILRYFGQKLDKPNCGACDVCLDEVDQVDDALVIAQKILSCMVRVEQRFGTYHVAQVLTGSKNQRIIELGHDQLSTYDLLSEYRLRDVCQWIEQLVGQGYARKSGEYNVVQVTEAGWQVLRGSKTPRLLKPAAGPEKTARVAKESWHEVDRGLFEHLRGVRRELAEALGVPAFVIFGDAALRDMARRRPCTPEDFLCVHGVGREKGRRYGKKFVGEIQQYLRGRDGRGDVNN